MFSVSQGDIHKKNHLVKIQQEHIETDLLNLSNLITTDSF